MADDHLVRVAVAARQLGIAPRQVRRYAGRLGDRDRTPPEVSPLRVRVSSVRVLMEQARSGRIHAQNEDRDTRKRLGTVPRDTVGTVPRDTEDTELTRLQAELDRKDLLLRAAEQELADARRLAEAFAKNVEDLRRLLPAAPQAEQRRRRPWWQWRRDT